MLIEKNKNDLLEEYEKADRPRRLHLYLQYPDLRRAFFDIDVNGRRWQAAPDGARLNPNRAGETKTRRGRWLRFLVKGFACK